MSFFKNAFELYINSSIHVALAVVTFTIITFFEHDIPLNLDLILFTFFATITGYNFVKYAGIARLHHLSLARNLRFIQIFSLFSFIALIYFVFQLKRDVIIAGGILGVLTMFYAIPLLGKEKNLRSLPGLKIFVIAVVWAGTTVILPLIDARRYIGMELIVDFLQRLMLVVVLTLPFEIRDLKFDNEQLGTIPQRLGVSMTKVFGTILIFLIFASDLVQNSFNSTEFLSCMSILILSGIMLWRSSVEQGKYYASFWVESLPIIYLGIYLLFRFVLPQIPF